LPTLAAKRRRRLSTGSGQFKPLWKKMKHGRLPSFCFPGTSIFSGLPEKKRFFSILFLAPLTTTHDVAGLNAAYPTF
jgi:hypothetical protein